MDFDIENLVFSGGGTKGFSFIGCLEVLEENNIIEGNPDKIKFVTDNC